MFRIGVSVISPFNPFPVGGQTRHQEVTLEMSAQTDIYTIPDSKAVVKLNMLLFTQRLGLVQEGGVYIPELKQRGFDTEI